ncbi:VWA domain-containing protein [Spirosoma daeguense]
MNWLFFFTRTEFIFIALFIGLYTLYIWRTFRLAKQLNTTAWGVVPKLFLRGSYLTLLIIALLGPSFGEAEGDFVTTDRDTYLIVDVSRSMDAGDVVPTRLERIKYDIQQLCDTLPTNRFGLILATDDPFVLSPLTADHNALKQFSREIHTNASPTGGADLCSSLDLARQKLLAEPAAQTSIKSIIVFSDGENFGACERTLMNQLRTQGVSVITVGIGTDGGASIRDGRDFVRDADRQIVLTRLNRSFLQELARDGRGYYLEADANGQYVNELVNIIRTLKGRSIDQRRIAVSTNKYYYFLLAALGLLALDLIVTIRTFRL